VSGLAVHPSEPVIATAAPLPRQPALGARIELWDSRSGTKLGELAGHSTGTSALAFSADGRWLVSGGLNDGSVVLWDWRARRAERTLSGPTDRPSTVHLLRFTPDDRAVVASLEPLNCRTDAGLCTLIYFPRTVELLPLHEGEALPSPAQHDHRSMAATAGGPWLGDGKQILREGDGARAAAPIELKDNDAAVLAVSPDGKAVAAGGDKVQIIEAASGRLLFTLPAQPGRVTALAYSSDGKLLFSGHEAGVIHAWSTDGYQRVGTFEGHRDRVLALAAAPAAGQVVSASADGTVRLWDAAQLRPQAQSTGSSLVVARQGTLAASSDGGSSVGRVIVGSETGLHLFDLELRRDVAVVAAATEHHEGLGFVADGESFLYRDGATQRLAQLGIGSCKAPLAASAATGASTSAGAVMPGRPLALASERGLLLTLADDGALELHDLGAGTEVARGRIAGLKVDDAVLDPKGRLLVARERGAASAAVDVAPDWMTPREVFGKVAGVELAPDGGRALLWTEAERAAAGSPPRPLLLEIESSRHWLLDPMLVSAATLGPDGRRLALADNQGTVHLYETPVGQAPRKLALLKADLEPVRALAFSADGQRLFSGGPEGRLRIWDAIHGLEVGSVDLGLGPILALAPAERASALGVASFRDDVRSVRWLYVPSAGDVELQRLRESHPEVDRAWAQVLAAPGAASAAALQRALAATDLPTAQQASLARDAVRRVLAARARASLDATGADGADSLFAASDVQALLGAGGAARLVARITSARALHIGADARSLEREAKALANAHRDDEAERAYAKALAAMQQQRRLTGCPPPRLVEALLDLGVLRYLDGRLAAAGEAWQAAADVAPADPRPLNNLGFFHFEQSDFDLALKAFDRALALDQAFVDALGGKAITLWRLGHDEEAAAAMRLAIARDPSYGRVQDLRKVAQWSEAQARAAGELLATLR
ncbi:tetratricopeptide repeat protein, partial [Paraburkholderia elongata]